MTGMSALSVLGKSPFKLLEDHARKTQVALDYLDKFFESTLGNRAKMGVVYNDLVKSKEAASDLKRKIRRKIHQDLYLSIGKSAFLKILYKQNDLARISGHIASLIVSRDLFIPEDIKPGLRNLLNKALYSCRKAEVAADALGVVIDSGFCKDERLGLIDLVKDIELAEDETMVLRVEVDQALVRIEEDLKPLDALCLYKVVSLIASLAGTAQDLGDQLIISVSV
jgi:uncharacterized protein